MNDCTYTFLFDVPPLRILQNSFCYTIAAAAVDINVSRDQVDRVVGVNNLSRQCA